MILTKNGKFHKRNGSLRDLQAVAPDNVRLGSGVTEYAEYKLVECTPADRPGSHYKRSEPLLTNGQWTEQWEERELTDSEKKLEGIDYNGVMLSATRSDQNGLTAIAMGILLAEQRSTQFPDVNFEFENGAKLVIGTDNFDAIYAVWLPFRQEFFS